MKKIDKLYLVFNAATLEGSSRCLLATANLSEALACVDEDKLARCVVSIDTPRFSHVEVCPSCHRPFTYNDKPQRGCKTCGLFGIRTKECCCVDPCHKFNQWVPKTAKR